MEEKTEKVKKHEIKNTPRRNRFMLTYGHMDEKEMLREMLFAQQIQIDKLERTRKNTSTLVWFLVAIPFVFGILAFMLGLFQSIKTI